MPRTPSQGSQFGVPTQKQDQTYYALKQISLAAGKYALDIMVTFPQQLLSFHPHLPRIERSCCCQESTTDYNSVTGSVSSAMDHDSFFFFAIPFSEFYIYRVFEGKC